MAEIPQTGIVPQRRHGASIGQPLTRRDGLLKVTGQARYAADNHPPGMLHAVLAVSSIARGRVTFLDVTAAKAHPGVVEVMIPTNRPPLALDPDAKLDPLMFRLDLLQNDGVRYTGQPIAVVIAETLEAATEAAALLSPRYEAEPARIGLDGNDSFIPPAIGIGTPPEVRHGDVEGGLAAAEHRIEAIYETQAQYHNAMEPHAIVAAWDGDRLLVDTPSQGLAWAQARLAGLFGIPPEDILIRSPFLGGGFGSKGMISGPQILGILAARLVGRPVKLVLRREQMYGPVGHRPPTRQTLRLGTDRQGALTAIHHHMRTATSSFDDFFEPSVQVSHTLYASPAIATTAEAVRLDMGTPLFMRAPGEASGSIALESAIDEMAQVVGIDPLEFRLKKLRRGRADLRQAVLLPRRCASAMRGVRRALAGRDVPWRRDRCVTRTGCWSGGVSAPRPSRPTCCSRAKPEPSSGAPGRRSHRSPPTASVSSSSNWSSGPAAPTCRTQALPAAPPTPRLPAWRFTAPAPT
jgi:xanthine dehydrogenase YagR molybdenum-binding subunit